MLPNVLHKLSEYGLETDLLAFFELVCENRFPFSNIAFQLWIEIGRYQQDSSTYNHEVHGQNKNVLEIRVANIWWKVYSLHGWLQK